MVTADSNVFVYAFDERETAKRAVASWAIARLRELRSPIALQVVGEFRNVVHRKLKMPLDQAAAIAFDLLNDYRTFAYDDPALRRALVQSGLGRLGFWDAVLVASAADVGCTVLLSEDMRDGAVFFGLEIVNPFGAAGLRPRAADRLGVACAPPPPSPWRRWRRRRSASFAPG